MVVSQSMRYSRLARRQIEQFEPRRREELLEVAHAHVGVRVLPLVRTPRVCFVRRCQPSRSDTSTSFAVDNLFFLTFVLVVSVHLIPIGVVVCTDGGLACSASVKQKRETCARADAGAVAGVVDGRVPVDVRLAAAGRAREGRREWVGGVPVMV
jgi:hypothetical protein